MIATKDDVSDKIDIFKNFEMSKEAIAFQGGVKMSKPQNWSWKQLYWVSSVVLSTDNDDLNLFLKIYT